jgi:hypothetical protein
MTPIQTTPSPESKPAASGAHLDLDIRGTRYALYRRTNASGAREVVLEKRDGTCYAVTEGSGGERTRCTCPDWAKRHEPLEHTEGCKHIRALVALGEMDNPRPDEPSGLAHATNEPDEMIADQAADWELFDSIVAAIGSAHAQGLLARRQSAPQCGARERNSSPHVVSVRPVYARPRRPGRPAKYEGIDWVRVAERHARGESRRNLAVELGVPQSVCGEKIRRAVKANASHAIA